MMGIPDNKHEALIDDENVEWIGDVPAKIHPLIQQLLIEGSSTGNELKMKMANVLMKTGGTRDGRHVDRVLEAVRERPDPEVDQDRFINMPVASSSEEPQNGGEEGGKGGVLTGWKA